MYLSVEEITPRIRWGLFAQRLEVAEVDHGRGCLEGLKNQS